MQKKKRIEDERRIFQSQLSALLEGGEGFLSAVRRIEASPDTRISQRIKSVSIAGESTQQLVEALAKEGLLHPDFSDLVRECSTSKVDTEIFLKKQLKNEVLLAKTNLRVGQELNRVLWLFGAMTFFSTVIYGYYSIYIFPNFFEFTSTPELPASMVGKAVTTLAFPLMALFLCFLFSIFLALRISTSAQWAGFRFLWKVPGLSSLFAKRATWRVFSHCLFLMEAGVPQEDAMEISLRAYGLKPASGLFPFSMLLDESAVRAANLGSSLSTFKQQMESTVAHIQEDLPRVAENASQVVVYVGYVLLGLLVGSMLVQMYEPIFKLAGVL